MNTNNSVIGRAKEVLPLTFSKSIKLASEMFESVYDRRKRYKAYHFAFAWNKNRLLEIGWNDYEQRAEAYNFGRRFNIDYFKRFKTLHAEIHLFHKMWGRYHIDNKITLVVVRLNKDGVLQDSKPCPHCQQVIDMLGITKVYYSEYCPTSSAS